MNDEQKRIQQDMQLADMKVQAMRSEAALRAKALLVPVRDQFAAAFGRGQVEEIQRLAEQLMDEHEKLMGDTIVQATMATEAMSEAYEMMAGVPSGEPAAKLN